MVADVPEIKVAQYLFNDRMFFDKAYDFHFALTFGAHKALHPFLDVNGRLGKMCAPQLCLKCDFFLKAVEKQANNNQTKANEISSLYESKKSQIVDMTRSQYAIYTLDFIFSRPIFNAKDFTGMVEEIPATTYKRILNVMLESEVQKNSKRIKRQKTSHLCLSRTDKHSKRQSSFLKSSVDYKMFCDP